MVVEDLEDDAPCPVTLKDHWLTFNQLDLPALSDAINELDGHKQTDLTIDKAAV